MRARMSPVEAMPWPFSPPMPTAKSILVRAAIWLLTVYFAGRSDLKRVQRSEVRGRMLFVCNLTFVRTLTYYVSILSNGVQDKGEFTDKSARRPHEAPCGRAARPQQGADSKAHHCRGAGSLS